MGNIRVIGPRNAGKTTYLAGLAYWHQNRNVNKGKKTLEIRPINDETEELATKAENIILEAADLEPTRMFTRTIDDLPSYSFQIEVKQSFKSPQTINLAARDYPGEVFEQLETGIQDPLHKEFMEECLTKDVEGCLILLSDWGVRTDRFYKRVFSQFLEVLDRYDRTTDLRLAIAISKCERGEIWPGRLDPELDIFEAHLPTTTDLLKSKVAGENLQFFAMSTFGVLHRTDPRPNRVEMLGADGSRAVLREPSKWKPYGIVDPLYWLSTGRRKEFTN